MNALLELNVGYRKDSMYLHNHDCAELYISLDGYAINEINGHKSKTLPLDVYVLTEDMMHAQPTTHKYRFCMFKFNLKHLLEQMEGLYDDPVFHELFIKEPELRRTGTLATGLRIDNLTSEYAVKTAQLLERETDPLVKDTLFFSLVTAICKNAKTRTTSEYSKNLERIFLTTTYMEEHFAEPLELSDLASYSNYSVRHFTRLFRSCYQVSPMDYLNQLRLDNAVTLLKNPNLSLSEIATLCGFSGSSVFSKVFRKHFGHTPSAHRKNILTSQKTTNALESAVILEY